MSGEMIVLWIIMICLLAAIPVSIYWAYTVEHSRTVFCQSNGYDDSTAPGVNPRSCYKNVGDIQQRKSYVECGDKYCWLEVENELKN